MITKHDIIYIVFRLMKTVKGDYIFNLTVSSTYNFGRFRLLVCRFVYINTVLIMIMFKVIEAVKSKRK